MTPDPNDPCAMCHGSKLLMGGWMGPTPQAPFPNPCPKCAVDLTPRARQVLQAQWLLDHQDEPRVKELLSRMAVFNARNYRIVLYLPNARQATSELLPLQASMKDVADADMVICAGNSVVKDRHGVVPYTLSDTEIRRIRDEAQDFRIIR